MDREGRVCALSAFWRTEMHGYIHSNSTNTVILVVLLFLDAKKRYIVLVLNYKVMPRDVKADLPELVCTIL